MEIRQLTETDSEQFYECRLRALKSTPTAFLISYDDEKAKGPTHFLKSLAHKGNERAIFGAFFDERLVATVGIYKEEHSKISHKAAIWGMHVDEGFRGQGIASRILDVALDFARGKMRAVSVSLSVESSNLAAKNLYLKKGFKTWGVEPQATSHEGIFLDEDHMIIFLES